MNQFVNGMMNGMDSYSRYIVIGIVGLFFGVIFWWFCRVIVLVDGFLKMAREVLGAQSFVRNHLPFFYHKKEMRGSYKGRDVVVGIVFAGLQGEFLPLPYISLRLKETLGYNMNRLPNYAVIEKNYLTYKVKLSVLWGVSDKNYPPVFSKHYLVIALERLLATAEDIERGRTLKEIFK